MSGSFKYKLPKPTPKPIVSVVHTGEAKEELDRQDAAKALLDLKTPKKGGYILSRRSHSKSSSKSKSRRTRSKRRVSRARTTRYLKKYE